MADRTGLFGRTGESALATGAPGGTGSAVAEALDRRAAPGEIAGGFALLTSDAAAFITGQVPPVDGRMVM